MHHRIGVGNGVATVLAEKKVHTLRIYEKTGADGFLEHPAKSDLGETAFGFRIAAADIAVNTGKPDLLEVAGAAARRQAFRDPEICPEKRPPLVDCDRLAADIDVGIVARVGKPQRIFIPADRADGIPDTDKPGFADPCRKRVLEVGGKSEIAL